MENYRVDDLNSINIILNSCSKDMFDGLTFVVRPVVGAIGYLRSMHKSYVFQKEIEKITNIDFETREKILDVFSDLVIEKNDEDFIRQLEVKINELNEIKDVFSELDCHKLNIEPKQMHNILSISLRRLDRTIDSIRDEINSMMWDSDEDIDQLLTLDQVFISIQEIIKETLDLPINKSKDSSKLNTLVYSLLYIEAYRRQKVSLEEFQDFLSFLSLYNYKEGKSLKDNDAVFEVLTV
ncbi:hypothetical protein [Methanolobus vulcani]|uniref:Uncharacterized protein n=1 Tax=Methanolobus vulcani TaxID=38026 RepID=A0A7Z8KLE4_9EURY|nr:hypothetical protein [Methanolobus vulcani]TQD23414.1 hypothetical protein FKV42_12845 [Methanolobus vulcani]